MAYAYPSRPLSQDVLEGEKHDTLGRELRIRSPENLGIGTSLATIARGMFDFLPVGVGCNVEML
jgi:hypothetical protein